MQKIKFGATGLSVSRVALGGIPIMRVSTEQALRVVTHALSRGVNFIDTAWGYGDSENKIGEALAIAFAGGLKREEVVISSKSPALDRKTFLEHLDQSLDRLKLTYLDIYHHHNISTEDKIETLFSAGGAYEGMVEAMESGKVRFAAVSAHNLKCAGTLVDTGRFAVLQYPFNFIDDDAAESVLPIIERRKMGFIAMKPLGGGMLDDAGLCFRFLRQYLYIVPDPGIEKTEEMDQILSVYEGNDVFTPEDKAEIEELKKLHAGNWCHRCDYCLPCPQEISISNVFIAKSVAKRMTPEFTRRFIGVEVEKAGRCTECGTCLPRCPYNLPIPDMLKAVRSQWEVYERTGAWPD